MFDFGNGLCCSCHGDCVLYSGYAANAAAAAEVNVQNGGPIERGIRWRNGQVTERFIDEQLMRLDKQVQMWGRVDQEQVHQLMDLVKKVG